MVNLVRNNPRHGSNEEQWVEPLRKHMRIERPRASTAQKVRVNDFERDNDDDNDVANEFVGRDVQRVVGRSGDNGGYKLKVDLASFDGNLDIECFLCSLYEVEWFFEYMKILEGRRVKLVVY